MMSSKPVQTTLEGVTIADVGELRQEVKRAETELAEAVGFPATFHAASARMADRVHAYVTALLELAPQVEGLVYGEISRYAGRLQRGWMMDPTEEVLSHFEILIDQYEALCDIAFGPREVERDLEFRRKHVLLRHEVAMKGGGA